MTEKKRNSNTVSQIILAVVVALLAGGTAPWWWGEVFPAKDNDDTEEVVNLTEQEETNNIWRKGRLEIPISSSNSGRVADLDEGNLIPLGTSISPRDADIFAYHSVHDIIIQPGVSKGDGITFDAQFLKMADRSIDYQECKEAGSLDKISQHIPTSNIKKGSCICMRTTEGRLARFSLIKENYSGNNRSIEIDYIVWKKE
ncbi:hypothetical protein LZ575_01295 [Antarcticibacterium sp. 1MA-6-2]|uniref:hypothetical protein n=1 Tax=Antarcticibacterium sp. 1MA-6-2 TaxID=2908210 RepID=UPI001F2BB166|nr:hypothetical protein [Antarcticibacterium sp. 1MA-6-2]UJH91450.1 hypothetical protein LZ575_01295 [Antarcticibacterium sp. 1MA-6-2]